MRGEDGGRGGMVQEGSRQDGEQGEWEGDSRNPGPCFREDSWERTERGEDRGDRHRRGEGRVGFDRYRV